MIKKILDRLNDLLSLTIITTQGGYRVEYKTTELIHSEINADLELALRRMEEWLKEKKII